jgi:hypothetical protein
MMGLEEINTAFDLMHAGKHPQRRGVLMRRRAAGGEARSPLAQRPVSASSAGVAFALHRERGQRGLDFGQIRCVQNQIGGAQIFFQPGLWCRGSAR